MKVNLSGAMKLKLVKEAEDIAKLAPRNREQISQLRNLVQVTQTESEVPVLRNFIQYQAGRKTTGKFWAGIHGDVIKTLEWIAAETGEDEALRRAAIQHFFGYMVRHYVYLVGVRK